MNECSEQEIARLLPLVSEQRREQALRYKHLHGQYCCLKSYTMLCELLAEWGRVNQLEVPSRPEFLYNEYGAPYIAGGPHFSISHCKHGIAVVINDTPVGIDIEAIRPFKDDLMRKTMNTEEQQRIISSTHPHKEFIRLWTQKEAFLKKKGTGIITDLHNTLSHCKDTVWKEICNLQLEYICTIASETD